MTVTANSPPATCGSGLTQIADYTSLPASGAFTAGGCTGNVAGCDVTLDCPNGQAWAFAFAGQGFTATITQAALGCMANAVGTRLPACPVATGDDGGGPADSGLDAQLDGPVDALSDALVDAAADAGPDAEAGVASEGGADASPDAGADAADAQGAEASVGTDAQAEASAGSDAEAEAGGDDGGEDAAADAAGE